MDFDDLTQLNITEIANRFDVSTYTYNFSLVNQKISEKVEISCIPNEELKIFECDIPFINSKHNTAHNITTLDTLCGCLFDHSRKINNCTILNGTCDTNDEPCKNETEICYDDPRNFCTDPCELHVVLKMGNISSSSATADFISASPFYVYRKCQTFQSTNLDSCPNSNTF